MRNLNFPLLARHLAERPFASRAVQEGAVIRRKARDVERFAGMERFMAEIDRRGYQVAENAGQLVICIATARPSAG